MWFRAVKQFTYLTPNRTEQVIFPGQLVDVLQRDVSERLLAKGAIVPKDQSHATAIRLGAAAPPHTRTKRIGLFVSTSPNYSGGRLHMYQYAVAMARNGAEVWLITNARPRWTDDYETPGGLHLTILGQHEMPPDFDIIMTDSKVELGKEAHEWAMRYPHIPFVCFNFETPNWVKGFAPAYAQRLGGDDIKKTFQAADIVLANSAESLKHCIAWLGTHPTTGVLPPAVNTDALNHPVKSLKVDKPYMVWSARGPEYKGASVVVEAIWSVEKPLDLVTFGNFAGQPQDNKWHSFYSLNGRPDVEKYGMMAGAVAVLAPSLFEGFGMVPGEALASGTPAIVYDLPVLRQNYGDRLTYVKWGDKNAFKRQLWSTYQARTQVPSADQAWARQTLGLQAMQDRLEHIPCHAMKRRSVTAHMICYGTPTAVEAVQAVYPHVDQVVIAYGRLELAGPMWPENGVLARLREMPDPDGKIQIEARPMWDSKAQMRNWAVRQARGNYMLVLDADEIWVGLGKWLAAEGIDWGCPRWVNLWHGPRHWICDHAKNAGRRWGYPLPPRGSVCPHYRFSWWRHSYTFTTHPVAADANLRPLCSIESNRETAQAVPEAVIYHLGHALPVEMMKAKHLFYERRDGAGDGRTARHQAWHDWDGKCGKMADGIVKPVDWQLPDIVLKACERVKE